MGNFCGNCGSAVEEGWKVCPVCATPLQRESQSLAEPPVVYVQPEPSKGQFKRGAGQGAGFGCGCLSLPFILIAAPFMLLILAGLGAGVGSGLTSLTEGSHPWLGLIVLLCIAGAVAYAIVTKRTFWGLLPGPARKSKNRDLPPK